VAFATFLVWRLRTGACGVGACGFWRYRMPPPTSITTNINLKKNQTNTEKYDKLKEYMSEKENFPHVLLLTVSENVSVF